VTDAIEFGPEIKRGSPLWPEGQDRPVWLADDMWEGVAVVLNGGETQWPNHEEDIRDTSEWVWDGIRALRFAHSHPASIAQRWNDDNPGEKPFTVPHVGKSTPSDWDGGEVLFECRRSWEPHNPDAAFATPGLAIAYRSKQRENPGLSADELLEKALAR